MKFISRYLFIIILFQFTTVTEGFSQLSGQVLTIKNAVEAPVGNATVRLLKQNVTFIADANGLFQMQAKYTNIADTLEISSASYRSFKLSLKQALLQYKFYLEPVSKTLENVTIFSRDASEGASKEVAGYFIAWKTRNTGSEIGRYMYINHDKYKLSRVRFKVNNMCDSCNVRVRVREKDERGLPGEELFRDSIGATLRKSSFDSKAFEIDLEKYNLVLRENEIFITMEVLGCGSTNLAQNCSFCFIGTEPGTYYAKQFYTGDWERYADTDVFLKLYYKY
ncbi:MAG: hypothetical protein WAT19_15350 [Ferruginibacter sp.]